MEEILYYIIMENKNSNIYLIYGNNPLEMTKKILSTIKIETFIKPDSLIGIKPNLVVSKPASSGATTSPLITAGIIEYLQEKGLKRLLIFEGSWVGGNTTEAFRTCGYENLSKEYSVPLLDTKGDDRVTKTMELNTPQGVEQVKLEVCRSLLDVDFLINLPVLKGHCQTILTAALKNLKGCIPDREKRRFHTLGLHEPIAWLNRIRTSDFILVDSLCGDIDFEEGGNPVQMDRLIAGFDPVLIDSYCATLLGYAPEEIRYIKIAESLGVGSADLTKAKVLELNKADTRINPPSSGRVKLLAKYTREQDACSACYANLIRALYKLEREGRLKNLSSTVHIGQGFKGRSFNGVGVGSCTKKLSLSLKGCPPTALEITEFLKNSLMELE